MKIIYIGILILLLDPIIFAQSGFKGGVNFSNYYGRGANNGGTAHDIFIGPTLGYFKDWNIPNKSDYNYYFSIGMETDISLKGAIIRNMPDKEAGYEAYKYLSDRKMYIYYLELPHLIKFNYCFSQNIKAQIYTGGNLSLIILNVTKTINSSYPNYSFNETRLFFAPSLGETPNFVDYSFIYGLTLYYKKILLDIRYIKGLVEVYPGIRFKTISTSLGYNL
ncbi:MAG: hypothetical protein P4L45_08220 [Ignavibacteriaceae bacterium]|nr:hypothetical protein [Ignavibacteriaceae bacterium]